MSLIIPANTLASGGYEVDNSLRFNDGSSDYLNRTPSGAGNRKTFTFSTWIKRGALSANKKIFTAGNNGTELQFNTSDNLLWYYYSGGYVGQYNAGSGSTSSVFRDVSAWYHIVLAVDTTQSTGSSRVKIYINGTEQTRTINEITQNTDVDYNNTSAHYLGKKSDSNADYYDGYMAETVLVDGSQLDATSFGEFDEDSGIWKPIDVSGLTFGTNGFYLDFENSGALGADVSGNTNNFTVNNLTAIDQTTDTPTNNFATLNPLDIPTANKPNTFSEGNLEITNSADENRTSFSSIGVQSGKWYFEAKFLSGEMKQYIGISKQETVDRIGASANSYGFAGENARKWNNNSYGSYGSTASTGDIIMVAFDADNGIIWVGKNGTWFESATQSEIENSTTTNAMYSSITIDDFFMMGFSMEDSNIQVNFGSPSYSESGGETDGNGYGNFANAVPSGYYVLNSKNLSEYG